MCLCWVVVLANGGSSQSQCSPILQEGTRQPTPNGSGNPLIDAPPIPNYPSSNAPTPTPNNNMEVDSEATQNCLSRLKIFVWEHFTKIKRDDGKDKAECNYCKKLLGGSSNDWSSHLKEHLLICPKRKLLMKSDKGQTFLTTTSLQGKQELGIGSYDAENARKEVAHAIILHEYPLSIVDHNGFRRYTTSLQPIFQVPSRNTIKKEILKVYNSGKMAITSDMWTSSNKKRVYGCHCSLH
jgi:aspartate carbamoyltransferase regulatory subunit